MRNLLYRYELSPKFKLTGYEEGFTEKNYFTKYFPKYYKKLSIDVDSPAIISKIKRSKKIHHFCGVLKSTQSRNLWYLLLGNKRRDIQSFPYTFYFDGFEYQNDTSKEKLKKVKFFYQIQILHVPSFPIPLDESISIQVSKDFYSNLNLKKASKYLVNLRMLRKIIIIIQDPAITHNIKLLFNKIAKSKILNNLRVLRFESDSGEFDEVDLSKILYDYDFCKKITSISLNGQKSIENWQNSKINAETCPNLRGLVFQSIGEYQMAKRIDNLFEKFEAFTHLESLEFECLGHIYILTGNFKLPLSIKHVKLCFLSVQLDVLFNKRIDWGAVLQSKMKNPFETNEICQQFYTQWENLQNLESLEVNFEHTRYPITGKYFITPLLKQIKNLLYFKYKAPINEYFAPVDADNTGIPEEQRRSLQPYLPFVCEDLTDNLKHSLKELRITITQFNIPVNWNFSCFKEFCNLKFLELKGLFSPGFICQDLVGILQNSVSNDQKNIMVRYVAIDSLASLKKLLKDLDKLRILAWFNLSIKLNVTSPYKERESIIKEFCNFQNQERKVRGVDLSLFLNNVRNFDEVDSIVSKFPRNGDFEVAISKNGMDWFRITFKRGEIVRTYFDYQLGYP